MTTTNDPATEIMRTIWPRRVRFAVLYSLYLGVLGFIGLKLYSYFVFDVPIMRTAENDDVWKLYYPELWKSGAIDADGVPDDDRLDVLLLGASVLEQMTEPLEAALKQKYGRNVRIYNLSKSAHTTRDSLLKFQRLNDRHFDLIVIYHGINDSRMNCVSENDYRDDYSHCAWYSSFQNRLESGAISMKGISAGVQKGKIGNGPPDAADRHFGRTIKTESAFGTNIESIVTAAESKKTPVLLMTFATYPAPNYSEQRFRENTLGYGEGRFQLPTEVWGEPDAVIATVRAHNRVLRDIAKRRGNVLFVDQQKLMPQTGTFFSDICHLTDAGCGQFVANLMPVITRPAK